MCAVYTAAGARESATGQRAGVQGLGTEGRVYGDKCEPHQERV